MAGRIVKPYTEPALIREVLDHARHHGIADTAETFGFSSRTVTLWVEERATRGLDWPTFEMQRDWETNREARRRKAIRKELWRSGHRTERAVSIDATGTRRRIQALCRLGWTAELIGRDLGVASNTVRGYAYSPTVTPSTAEKVAATYDALSMQLGPSRRTASRAEKCGWRPPLAWDDPDTDPEPASTYSAGRNPDEVDPVTVRRFFEGDQTIPTTRAEKETITAEWVRRGGSVAALGRTMGWRAERYVVSA